MASATNISKMKTLRLDSPFFDSLPEPTIYDSETKEQIRRFREEGVLVFDPEISEEKLDGAIQDLRDGYQGTERIQDDRKKFESAREIATWRNGVNRLPINLY